jgi:hypothetical protein
MDTILLRTLTGKSKIHFGKYSGLTIDEIINLGHTAYLRRLYFNISSVNFTDEILEKIHVSYKYRIHKPGINKEFELLNFKSVFAAAGDLNRSKISKKINKNNKINYYNLRNRDRIKFSKINMARKNQGH